MSSKMVLARKFKAYVKNYCHFNQLKSKYHDLLYQFNACDNRTQSSALFQNIFKFCTFLPKLSKFFLFLTFFCPFLPFFWKIACMPLLSRIGPEYLQQLVLTCPLLLRAGAPKIPIPNQTGLKKWELHSFKRSSMF